MFSKEAKLLFNIGVTPNQISVVGIFLAFLAGFFYWVQQNNAFFLVIAPVLFLLSGFCDALDGAVARLHGRTTIFGGFLDSLLDRYADAIIFVALIIGGLCDIFWGSVALIGSLMVSYTRARAEAAGVKMETIGLVERAERIIILSLASFITFFWSNARALYWAVILLAVLTHLTVLQRTIHFLKASSVKGK